MLDVLLSWRSLLLVAWIGAASFVHFRGKVRQRFRRQPSDHSTLEQREDILFDGICSHEARNGTGRPAAHGSTTPRSSCSTLGSWSP